MQWLLAQILPLSSFEHHLRSEGEGSGDDGEGADGHVVGGIANWVCRVKASKICGGAQLLEDLSSA